MLARSLMFIGFVAFLSFGISTQNQFVSPARGAEIQSRAPNLVLTSVASCRASCRAKVNKCKYACPGKRQFAAACKRKCDQEKRACYKRCGPRQH
jgi:hypothetical protein